ncbi:DNA polymerase phi subunit [Cryptococcus neoformans]|nr:DNA polymerase phi subunit [Cryptococcus neoformans var. grubii]
MTSNVLPLFWPLSNSSKETRITASASLVSSLESFQRSFSQNAGSSKGKESEDGDEDEESASDSEESAMEVDASDDEEGKDEKDSQAAKLDRQLSKDNAEDVVYSVKRLVRGLGSSRENSRLGFAVALTELLSRIPTVTARQVFSLVIRNSQYSKNMKGSDERDMMFARLFGMTAIVQSQSLFAPSATKDDFRGVIEELEKLGQAKAWMRESAWWTLVQSVLLLLGSKVQWKEDALHEVIDVVFEEKGWTQEKVALVLTLEQSGIDIDWKTYLAPTFKHNPLLSIHNLVTLGRILKETTGDEEDGVSATITGSWKPQLHFVWNIILDRYFGSSALSTTLAPFQDFFRVVVDESLLSNTSSPQRRYWGFQVFERALPLLPSSQMPLIFTPNFMRCWMNNLSSPDRYLHKAAQQIAKKVQGIIKENPKVGFTLLSQLVGKHGRPDFDKVTKTKTVESIMGKLNEEGVKDFVDFLKETILGASSHENLDTARLAERRSWALDQIQALCRNGSVPKDDTWVSPLFDFLLVHGFFIIRSANKKSPVAAIHYVPKPPLSENTSTACRAKFFACAVELTTASIPRKNGSEDSKARQQGCDASGRLWLRRAIDIVSILVDDKKHVEVIADADEEIKSIRNTALESLSSLDKVKEDRRSISKAFEILISFFILQTYDEVEDSLENLEEVNTAAQQYLGQKEEEETQAVDLLLDVLIALLDKGSSDLRNLANLVFDIISPELTKSSLDLLSAQLEQSAAEAAANESAEESDGDADGDDAASDSDDGETNEEDEDEEEGEEDDEDLGDVDPAFRQRVAEALKMSGMDAGEDVEEGSEAESEEYWDDDQMMKVDEQLAQVFRERAAAASKNDMKHILTESIHFKNRILDFYDTYAKRQPTNPLIIDVVLTLLKLIRSGGVSEAEVANKAAGILRSKFNKPKDVPSTVDVEAASESLKAIHSMARKAHSAEFSTLCSVCSLFVSRAIDASSTTSSSTTSAVVDIYRTTLKDFMIRKASLVHPPFLLEFVKRFPLRAFSLHDDLVNYVAPGASVNAFRQLQAYNALQILAQHLPVISKSLSPSEVAKFVQEASGSVFTTLETAAEASSDSKDALNAQKLKDIVKFALQLARNSKNVGVSWDIRRVSEVGETLKHGRRTKEMKGVHSMWIQLEAILGNKKGEKRKR